MSVSVSVCLCLCLCVCVYIYLELFQHIIYVCQRKSKIRDFQWAACIKKANQPVS